MSFRGWWYENSWSQKPFCSLLKTWMWIKMLDISYRRDLPQNMRYGQNQGFQKGGRDSGRWPDTILVVRAARPLWESPLRQTEQGNVRGGVYDGNACLKWKVEACLQIPILRDRVLTIDALMFSLWFFILARVGSTVTVSNWLLQFYIIWIFRWISSAFRFQWRSLKDNDTRQSGVVLVGMCHSRIHDLCFKLTCVAAASSLISPSYDPKFFSSSMRASSSTRVIQF